MHEEFDEPEMFEDDLETFERNQDSIDLSLEMSDDQIYEDDDPELYAGGGWNEEE